MGIVVTLYLAQQALLPTSETQRAVIDIRGEKQVRIRNVVIDGQRDRYAHLHWPIAENGAPFIDYYPLNGIAIDRCEDVVIENVVIRNVTNLAIVVARSSNVRIERVTIEDSGSLDAKGKNNTTGGILLEEGTSNFVVANNRLSRIRGNAIWTHSYTVSPRNRDGQITNNEIDTAGRDAIQVGHAVNVMVDANVARNVGYPVEIAEGEPVGIDTAGNVENTHYRSNRLFEINGKCFDLDGFHDGSLICNLCINARPVGEYPLGNFGIVFNDSHPESVSRNIAVRGNVLDGMKYGAMFVIGAGHTIEDNAFLNLNRARSKDGLLGSSIHFANGVLRPNPPKGVVVRGNTMTGTRCVAPYPGVKLEKNECR
ncbi:MAG: right-handed parallel beta-helix repeat-containing protein [Bryobacteraceae bacterium]|nr:right-handed parallel beta-helix repeat-containing protein [Bryobacteraceae bacterium]